MNYVTTWFGKTQKYGLNDDGCKKKLNFVCEFIPAEQYTVGTYNEFCNNDTARCDDNTGLVCTG